MRTSWWHNRTILANAMLILVVGCETRPTASPTPPPSRTSATRLVAGTTGFFNFARDGERAGIDYACVHSAKWDNGEIAYLIWSDLGRSGGFKGGPEKGALFTHDPDRRIEYTIAEKEHGRDAVVTINGQEFQLTKGALFLVSMADEQTVIRQLDFDLSTVGSGESREKYKTVADSNAELQHFFSGPKPEQ